MNPCKLSSFYPIFIVLLSVVSCVDKPKNTEKETTVNQRNERITENQNLKPDTVKPMPIQTPKVVASPSNKLPKIVKVIPPKDTNVLQPVEIKSSNSTPESWSRYYDNSTEYQGFYKQSLQSFFIGWKHEIEKHPSRKISEDEFFQIYRSKMETLFYPTPSFIEYAVMKLKSSSEFQDFKRKNSSLFNVN